MATAAPRQELDHMLSEIRGCRHCAAQLPHAPRPVLQASATARLCIVGQAPGTRVHATGIPFNDPSGDRLRTWLGIGRDTFYDAARIAIIPMGFCFPGQDARGGDLPPRAECAELWRGQLFELLGAIELTLLVGQYAQAWHLAAEKKASLTETVKAWQEYRPRFLPLPHPSWRNNAWLRNNPWFERELIPVLQKEVQRLVD